MKINVIGGGPAGLYFALLAKRDIPGADVNVYERNPKEATYGFGIVLADRGLGQLEQADAVSFKALLGACFVTRHRVVSHPDETVFVEGGGFGGAIARLRLLRILEDRCVHVGAKVHHDTPCEDVRAYEDADLVVGADGVNSALRERYAKDFAVSRYLLTNRLAWYGTDKHFAYPLLAFKRHGGGHFIAAAYPYSERMSTFVAECDARTWLALGMEEKSDDQRKELAETVFAQELGGRPLVSNKSAWRPLPVVRCEHWSVGHRVLIGDALHSAHPSIGSGTRIAMEDAIALASALSATPADVAGALVRFRQAREPAKKKLLDAAQRSFDWYETFSEKVEGLQAPAFVFDFLRRTGRLDDARLASEYPIFMAKYGHLSSAPTGVDQSLLT